MPLLLIFLLPSIVSPAKFGHASPLVFLSSKIESGENLGSTHCNRGVLDPRLRRHTIGASPHCKAHLLPFLIPSLFFSSIHSSGHSTRVYQAHLCLGSGNSTIIMEDTKVFFSTLYAFSEAAVSTHRTAIAVY